MATPILSFLQSVEKGFEAPAPKRSSKVPTDKENKERRKADQEVMDMLPSGKKKMTITPDMATKVTDYVKDEVGRVERNTDFGSPKAQIVADDEVVQSFFSKTHGSSFDPQSRADQGKMKQILKMVNSDHSLLKLTPGKFAVKVYSM